MKTLLCVLALAVSLSAQTQPSDQKQTPIQAEYVTIVSALRDRVLTVQAEATKALEKIESTMCAEAAILRANCLVDWQRGTVGVKPEPKPEPDGAVKQ